VRLKNLKDLHKLVCVKYPILCVRLANVLRKIYATDKTCYLKELKCSAPAVLAQLFKSGSTVSLKFINRFTNCTNLHGENAAFKFVANSIKSKAGCAD
jgi:hypothetical protein